VKVGDTKMTYVQIEGTFLFKMRPRPERSRSRDRTTRLGLIFEVKGSPIQVRLTGPSATVDHYKKGFEEWFGRSSESGSRIAPPCPGFEDSTRGYRPLRKGR
jgi:hypothetical protein